MVVAYLKDSRQTAEITDRTREKRTRSNVGTSLTTKTGPTCDVSMLACQIGMLKYSTQQPLDVATKSGLLSLPRGLANRHQEPSPNVTWSKWCTKG